MSRCSTECSRRSITSVSGILDLIEREAQ